MAASFGKWREWLGEAVHYCLSTGHSPSLFLGMVEHVTTLEGLLSGQDTYPAPSGGAEYINTQQTEAYNVTKVQLMRINVVALGQNNGSCLFIK